MVNQIEQMEVLLIGWRLHFLILQCVAIYNFFSCVNMRVHVCRTALGSTRHSIPSSIWPREEKAKDNKNNGPKQCPFVFAWFTADICRVDTFYKEKEVYGIYMWLGFKLEKSVHHYSVHNAVLFSDIHCTFFHHLSTHTSLTGTWSLKY